jgi:hypothetical protein
MKKRIYFSILLIGLVYLLQIFNIQGALYSATDPTDDIRHYHSSTLVETGDYFDEIDIISFEIDTDKLKMTLDVAPINDINHFYFMSVYWDGDDTSKNYTVAQIGLGINSVLTSLYDNQDSIVAYNLAMGVVSIVGNSVESPIPAFGLIQNPTDPKYIEIYASLVAVPDYYADNLTLDHLPTSAASGFHFEMVILSLIVLVFIPIIISRTKK